MTDRVACPDVSKVVRRVDIEEGAGIRSRDANDSAGVGPYDRTGTIRQGHGIAKLGPQGGTEGRRVATPAARTRGDDDEIAAGGAQYGHHRAGPHERVVDGPGEGHVHGARVEAIERNDK